MNNRILDPINYKEACFWIEYQNMFDDQKEYIDSKNTEELFSWLGSNCGEYYLNRVKKLIEEYPYKESSSAIVCGEIINRGIVDGHRKWIEEKLK